MKYLVIFILSFLIIYLFYFVTVIKQKKRIEKFKKSNQVMYFVNRYNLDLKKIDINLFMQTISLTNSFIISVAFTGTFLVDNLMLSMLIGLLILIPLMLICYDLIGNFLKKKEK